MSARGAAGIVVVALLSCCCEKTARRDGKSYAILDVLPTHEQLVLSVQAAVAKQEHNAKSDLLDALEMWRRLGLRPRGLLRMRSLLKGHRVTPLVLTERGSHETFSHTMVLVAREDGSPFIAYVLHGYMPSDSAGAVHGPGVYEHVAGRQALDSECVEPIAKLIDGGYLSGDVDVVPDVEDVEPDDRFVFVTYWRGDQSVTVGGAALGSELWQDERLGPVVDGTKYRRCEDLNTLVEMVDSIVGPIVMSKLLDPENLSR